MLLHFDPTHIHSCRKHLFIAKMVEDIFVSTPWSVLPQAGRALTPARQTVPFAGRVPRALSLRSVLLMKMKQDEVRGGFGPACEMQKILKTLRPDRKIFK